MTGRGIAIALLTVALAATAHASRLRVESDPEGFDAWAGERYIGRTPVEADLPAGRVLLRLAPRAESLFVAPVADTLLVIPEAETLTVLIRTATTVSVRSRPFDLPLRRDGIQIGRTPLDFPLDARRPGRIDLLTPSGPVPVPTDTLLARGVWSWTGSAAAPETPAGRRASEIRRLGRFGLPGLAIGFATAGILVKRSADRSYERYRKTADPGEIRSFYDQARRKDMIATALWTGVESCIIASVVAWILPEHAARRPGEEDR